MSISAISPLRDYPASPLSIGTARGTATAFDAIAVAAGLHPPDRANPDAPRAAPPSTEPADSITQLTEARDRFHKEASLTPVQRARRDVLKAMELTEEAIAAMPPDQKKDVEIKITIEVQRRLREQGEQVR